MTCTRAGAPHAHDAYCTFFARQKRPCRHPTPSPCPNPTAGYHGMPQGSPISPDMMRQLRQLLWGSQGQPPPSWKQVGSSQRNTCALLVHASGTQWAGTQGSTSAERGLAVVRPETGGGGGGGGCGYSAPRMLQCTAKGSRCVFGFCDKAQSYALFARGMERNAADASLAPFHWPPHPFRSPPRNLQPNKNRRRASSSTATRACSLGWCSGRAAPAACWPACRRTCWQRCKTL